jgi:hypothetical protein
MSDPTPRGGVPSSNDLLTAVVECLRDELLPTAGGRDRYQLQVCVAALEIVQREQQLSAEIEAAQTELLRELGQHDNAALLAEIKAGPSAARFSVLVTALRRRVEADLRVVRPSAVTQDSSARQ